MFGFLKKKTKDKDAPEKNTTDNQAEHSPGKPSVGDGESGTVSAKHAKKKKSAIKLPLILFLCLIAIGASAFTVYKLWFTPKPADGQSQIYTSIKLAHVNLPGEMLEFSFYRFPELYKAMLAFNREMDLFEKEIERIDRIAQTYPDQKKIAEKEKKTWVKAKDTLKKTFLKVEKPVKETYVLFRVNEEQGLMRIQELNNELTQTAQDALIPAQLMTEKLKQQQVVPEGFLKGTLYKLKKKFL